MKKVNEFILRNIADEYLLIPTGKTTEVFNGMITLTQTAAFIYEHIEETASFDELVDLILEEYEIDRDTVIKDTAELLQNMMMNQVLGFTDPDKKW